MRPGSAASRASGPRGARTVAGLGQGRGGAGRQRNIRVALERIDQLVRPRVHVERLLDPAACHVGQAVRGP